MYLINVHERHIHNYTYDQLTIDLVSFQFIFITLYILQHITQLDQQVTTGGNRKEGITLEPSLL